MDELWTLDDNDVSVWFSNCKKYTTAVKDFDMWKAMCMWGQEKALYLLLNFAVNLKLF